MRALEAGWAARVLAPSAFAGQSQIAAASQPRVRVKSRGWPFEAVPVPSK
jgi:hypothetical protein